jgi:hypothetical protein
MRRDRRLHLPCQRSRGGLRSGGAAAVVLAVLEIGGQGRLFVCHFDRRGSCLTILATAIGNVSALGAFRHSYVDKKYMRQRDYVYMKS